MELLALFSTLGTIVFAASGTLMGLRRGMDIVGIAFLATLTGIGGGTVRDIMLGRAPLGWVTDPTAIGVCCATAVILSVFNRRLHGRRMHWLLHADAAGVALFAVLGASEAAQAGAHPAVCIIFGAITATFGGIIRDVICGEVPVILSQQIYVTAAMAGALVYVLMLPFGGFGMAALLGFLAGFVLRVLAIRYDWSLPFPRNLPPSER